MKNSPYLRICSFFPQPTYSSRKLYSRADLIDRRIMLKHINKLPVIDVKGGTSFNKMTARIVATIGSNRAKI